MSLSAARSRVLVALTVLLALLAGCASSTVDGQAQPPGGGSGTDPSTPWEPPAGPPTGPAAGATVVARWTEYPGFFCQVDRTLVATTTVYSDGTVLLSDGIGASCTPPPRFTAGYADLAGLRTMLGGYFDGADAGVDMDHLPVADLGWSELSYVDQQGGEHVASAYGLFIDDTKLDDVPADVRRARAALRAVSDGLDGMAGPDTAEWTPDAVVVVNHDGPDYRDADIEEWPWPASAELSQLLDSEDGCLAITGDDAATLWTAAATRETSVSSWTIDGSLRYGLGIGAVLPGSTPCAG